MRLYIYYIIGVLVSLGACQSQTENPEEKGQELLNQARNLLEQGNTNAARDTILSLRQRYPLAIEVRRQAILTMDSIELKAAITAGDTLKIDFYKRKTAFDKEHIQQSEK